MLYFQIGLNDKVVAISSEYQKDPSWKNRNDFRSLERAQEIATQAIELTGKRYVAVDQGAHTSPRYDVIKAPEAGDKVSYAFNGDYYPDGEIVSVSPTLVVKTSTGNTYRRRKQTANWLQTGGTWALVHGHVKRRNPSF